MYQKRKGLAEVAKTLQQSMSLKLRYLTDSVVAGVPRLSTMY